MHGFGTAKENCFLLAQMMPTTHFIAVDLPPFGESDPTSVEQFDAPSLVRFIDRFHDALHLSTVQVIGTSMGGALAVAYAAEHPEDVCALILLGPAGLCAPIENDFVRAARKDLNPISMQSIEELDQTMALVFKRVPPAPMPIKRYLVNNAVERREFIEKAAIGLRPFLLDGGLNDLLGRIHQPTLVLFGDDDQVIDASCLPLFLERMPSASGELIPDAGHVLFVDAPRAVMKAIEAFEKKLAEDGPCVSSTER
ncbi:MAG: alpha/beta fold hydrolase [Planctomycetota bacterium]|nr:alpha/beta fold hydrolase [Planctomycetota bacterium]